MAKKKKTKTTTKTRKAAPVDLYEALGLDRLKTLAESVAGSTLGEALAHLTRAPKFPLHCVRCGDTFMAKDGGAYTPFMREWRHLDKTRELIEGTMTNWALCEECLSLLDAPPRAPGPESHAAAQ